MGFVKEFREFIARGNVLDLAIGIVIGAAFTKIVNSLVADIIMPLIGLVAKGVDFTKYSIHLSGESYIYIGKFIQSIIDFVIVAFAVFMLIKAVNRFRRKEVQNPVPAPPTKEQMLLEEIRDLLKNNRA